MSMVKTIAINTNAPVAAKIDSICKATDVGELFKADFEFIEEGFMAGK